MQYAELGIAQFSVFVLLLCPKKLKHFNGQLVGSAGTKPDLEQP
jgi:hypothetical protein